MTYHRKPEKLFTLFGEPINAENFERYKIEYGEERAEGYLQAIREMNEALGDIVRPSEDFAGAQKMRTRVDKFYFHNFEFLKSIADKDFNINKSEPMPKLR